MLQHLTFRWGALTMMVIATGTYRFGALRRQIAGISERMLAQTLQALKADGMVKRQAHDVVPPYVEYSLTPLGLEAAAHVVALAALIEARLPLILADRAA